MVNVEVFWKVGQRSQWRSQVQNLWYGWEGLVIKITHAKYERLISKSKKVTANVKIFDGQTDRMTDWQTDRVITIGHPPSGGALKKEGVFHYVQNFRRNLKVVGQNNCHKLWNSRKIFLFRKMQGGRCPSFELFQLDMYALHCVCFGREFLHFGWISPEVDQEKNMCLWNTDAPGGNKVKLWQKSLSPTFWPRPTPGACDVSEVWATLRWTYSPSLVTVWPPKLKILHFV